MVGFLTLAVVLTGCTSGPSGGATAGSGATTGSKAANKAGGPFKIVLSNHNVAQSWRVQMMNGAKYVAATKYKDKVDFQLQVSEDSPSAQTASLQQIIRQKPDAILVDASSPTALNGVLQQACNQGILVLNFDQTVENLPCAYKLRFANAKYSADAATFMCAQLGGKGNILLDQAVAGLPNTDLQDKVMIDTLAKKCPNVKIVGKYQSLYQPGPEAQAVGTLLSSKPKVDGVMSFAYCSSVIQAFERAGRPPVPMTCVAANNNAVACAKAKTPCYMWGNPPLIASIALKTAVDVLDGKQVEKDFIGFDKTYVINGVDFEHQLPVEKMTAGQTYFPEQSSELILPVDFENFGITPQVAMTGK